MGALHTISNSKQHPTTAQEFNDLFAPYEDYVYKLTCRLSATNSLGLSGAATGNLGSSNISYEGQPAAAE